MRQITITIYPRLNTNDNTYIFNSQQSNYEALSLTNKTVNASYEFISLELNYSIQSSNVTSVLILGITEKPNVANILRSGQPIEITENGATVFQGQILAINYKLQAINNNEGGYYAILTLCPSIFQLTLLPMLFDPIQKGQIDNLLNIDTTLILAGGVGQEVDPNALTAYMESNTDFFTFFNRNIQAYDLPSTLFLMSEAGSLRDNVLRSSIDVANVVFYQREDGTLIIRQLDASLLAPFNIDLANNVDINVLGVLSFDYHDRAALTPAVVGNYSILSPDLGVAANVVNNYISIKPNPQFYPRVQQLQNTGWFSGILGHTPINNNIVSNPTMQKFLTGLQTTIDQYLISSGQIGAAQDFITAYQTLLTAKEAGQMLTNYATLEFTITPDDPYYVDQTNQYLLGKCININNCELSAGIIATYTRTYSKSGTHYSFNVVPIGSITGFWGTSGYFE